MKLTILSDQISRDLETACEQFTSWGGRDLELRAVGSGLIGSDLSPAALQDLCATLHRWDVRVAGLTPGAFRLGLQEDALRYHRRILLPAALHLAHLLGTQVVHVSAPKRPEGAAGTCPDQALEVLADAAELAGTLGLLLGLENQPGSWAETGAELAAVAGAVGHHALKITWDPATSMAAGEQPFPTGLEAVRGRLLSLRLRDAVLDSRGVRGVLPGDGECGLPALLQGLLREGFAGTVALDPHLTPRLEGSRAAFETAQRMIASAARTAVMR